MVFRTLSALTLLGALLVGWRMLRTRHGFRRGVYAVMALALIVTGGIAFWYTHRPLPERIQRQPLFQGVHYTREIRREPRPIVIHVVEIDLDTPGLAFLVTPGDDLDDFDYAARTTSQ